MKISHVQKTSFIDYPGRISAVVFVQGCNFRCPYCHNPELVDPDRYTDTIDPMSVYSFLEKRRGKLDAVVVTGGEPTLQNGLIPFLQKVRSLGYLIKLDTNGSRPYVVQNALRLNLIDYIAMDIKAPWEKYSSAAGSMVDISKIRESISSIMSSAPAYEFRTTIVSTLHSRLDILNIGEMIQGAERYVLQKFVPSKHLDRTFSERTTFSEKEMVQLASDLSRVTRMCIVR